MLERRPARKYYRQWENVKKRKGRPVREGGREGGNGGISRGTSHRENKRAPSHSLAFISGLRRNLLLTAYRLRCFDGRARALARDRKRFDRHAASYTRANQLARRVPIGESRFYKKKENIEFAEARRGGKSADDEPGNSRRPRQT